MFGNGLINMILNREDWCFIGFSASLLGLTFYLYEEPAYRMFTAFLLMLVAIDKEKRRNTFIGSFFNRADAEVILEPIPEEIERLVDYQNNI